ncbi:MAG: sugar ABC transporter permease [Chloroflexi bacterium]|nr:sugar ABC transporter permease [Chloroflexota bacterium]
MSNAIESAKLPATVSTPTRRKGLSLRAREELIAYLLISPWIIGFLVFTLGALIFSLVISFYNTDLMSPAKFIGLGNYKEMFTDDELFWKALKVTSLYTLGVVPLQIIFGLFVALLLNQKIRGIGIWRTVFYLPSVVSGVAVAMIWIWFFQPDFGLVNGVLVQWGVKDPPRWMFSESWALPMLIITSVWSIGPGMLIFLAGLQSIPLEMYEAAQLDGANGWRQFTNITIPMLSPQILFNSIMGIIGSYQVFTASFIITNGGPNNATLTMVLYLYQRGFLTARFGYAAALAWVLFLIILVFTLFTLRSSRSSVFYGG